MIVTISLEDILHYANISKDQAPIHIDEPSAKKAGFERPIVHGMYIMGLAQSIYLKANEHKWIVQYSMRFQKPLLVDEMVQIQFVDQQDTIQVSVLLKGTQTIAVGEFQVKEWS